MQVTGTYAYYLSNPFLPGGTGTATNTNTTTATTGGGADGFICIATRAMRPSGKLSPLTVVRKIYPAAGSHRLSVVFTPDRVGAAAATGGGNGGASGVGSLERSVTLTVRKAVPTLVWAGPGAGPGAGAGAGAGAGDAAASAAIVTVTVGEGVTVGDGPDPPTDAPTSSTTASTAPQRIRAVFESRPESRDGAAVVAVSRGLHADMVAYYSSAHEGPIGAWAVSTCTCSY